MMSETTIPTPNTPIRVLLIDDDEDDFILTSGLLREIGGSQYQVCWVNDYDRALEHLCGADCADVCLLDYRLGERNGIDLLAEAKARGCSVPVILLTGQGDHETDVAAMNVGAADFLHKSLLTPDLLERSIRYGIQQKKVEEQRTHLLAEQAARIEAENANRMMDEFLATLSHELRTPLSAILMWVQFLRSPHAGPADLQQGLEAIERSAKVQIQLVRDLLDVSCIVSGKLTLDLQSVDLSEVLHAALVTVQQFAEEKKIRIEQHVENDLPPVSGDSARLQQVVWNLLSNAIKFTPEGGQVELRLERVKDHAQITVRDSGQGICPAFLPYVFDRFRQADSSSTRKYSGLGLGLSIVQQLVAMHGGVVSADSAGEGKGAVFAVQLPLGASVEEQQAAGGDGRATLDEASNRLNGVRILVVDDEPDFSRLVRRVLTEQGAEVVNAASSAEALKALETFEPHILLSDIAMPGQDGYELIRRARVRLPGLPAIAMTAYARPEDRRRALMAGFQKHLAKPIDPRELVTVVARLARRSPADLAAKESPTP
jgi:signal transduction histidine kinase